MKPIFTKACGKFILLGEHFVVPFEGQKTEEIVPALAFPLTELYCEVKLVPEEHPHYRAELPEAADRDIVESFMARATYAAADSLCVDILAQPFRIESSSNFPLSRGFGSSAAFSVALARAFDAYRTKLTGKKAEWQEILKATDAVEKIFHGRPSGVDAAVIVAGHPIRFENGMYLREVANDAVDFVVVDSGLRENSMALIKQVSGIREKNTSRWARMAGVMRELVDSCETALRSGQSVEVAKSVREAHGILTELELSNENIDSIIETAVGFGALGGKVSGAGGGGAVVILAQKGDGKRISQKMRDFGCSVMATVS